MLKTIKGNAKNFNVILINKGDHMKMHFAKPNLLIFTLALRIKLLSINTNS